MTFTSLLLPLALAACSDGASDPALPDQGNGLHSAAAIVEVSPAEAHIAQAGEAVTLTVSLRDARGRTVGGKLVRWLSLQPAVAQVDANGTVTGVTKGSALVQASVDGVADTARIFVEAGPADAVSLTILPQLAAIETVGSTFDFALELLNAAGDQVDPDNVSWESLDKSIATVSSSGRVIAVDKGIARIVARSGDLTDTAQVQIGTVTQAASVQIVPELTTLAGPGASAPLSIILKDAQGGMLPVSDISWSSSSPSIAKVSSAGVVTGISPGLAQITAKHGTLEAYAAVEVGGESQPARVVVYPEVDTIATIGATLDLSGSVLDADGNEVLSASLTWSSLDPAAAVVGRGQVAAVRSGVARVVARHGSLADTSMIWVAPAPPSAQPAALTVVPAVDTIPALGGSLALTATVSDAEGQPIGGKAVDWQSLDPAIAAVSSAGVATAKAKGKARIVAAYESLSDTAVIHVSPAPDPEEDDGENIEPSYRVTINPNVDTIPNLGGTLLFEAVIVDASGKPVVGAEATWSTLDAGIVSLGEAVARKNNINALQQGTVRIIASYKGSADTATVAVAPGVEIVTPAAVRVTPAADTIAVIGGSVQLTGHVLDDQGKILIGNPVKWSSLDPGIAAVSNGKVTGLAPGVARIRASSGVHADTAFVTVALALSSQPVAISLSSKSHSLAVGSTVQLSATVRDGQNKIIPGAPLTWTSEDPTIATVGSTGYVTGVSAGTTRVFVQAGTIADTANVTVTAPPTGGGVTPPQTGLKALVEEVVGPVALPPGAAFDSLLALSLKWSDHAWQYWRKNPSSISVWTVNYYDFAALMYYLGALTDDAKWALRADSLVKAYCTYACKPGSMVQPHQWQPRGVEIYARRTKDPIALQALDLYASKLAHQLDGTAAWGYFIGGDNANMDSRQVARSISSVLAGIKSLGKSGLAPLILGEAVPRLETMQLQDPSGARWMYNRPVNENAIFHGALVVHALGDAERRGFADPRIAAISDRWLDDAWTFARPTKNCQGLVRTTLPYDYNGGTPKCYHHTLNGINIVPFAQRYARTHDPAHLQQVMDLLDGSLASETWDAAGKQFMEVARTLWAAGIVGRAQGY